ncbi:MAG: rod shape-determining protein MreC [Clostridiales bacterium]|jgi:rod shape-determining protein MreC|nr:rod shape-determining protein MreC [Clostridiales bacterium]
MEFLKTHKKLFIIVMTITCIATIIITINTDIQLTFLRNVTGFFITPIQTGVSNVSKWVGRQVTFFSSMNELQKENEELKRQNEELRMEISRLQFAETENIELSELLELDREYSQFPKTGAKIISKDPSDWYDAYTINKGTKSGLSANMIALATGGLMGIITECYDDYSIVISIIDERSSISSKCVRTEDQGFVKGDAALMRDGLCRMEYIDADAEILEGDQIVTSQLSAYYPAGITIGYVKEVVPDPNGLTQHAIIQPAISVYQLETLMIVTQKSYSD